MLAYFWQQEEQAMSLVVNTNTMAANVARNVNDHYGRLHTSTQRLSSGLRITAAADDAAGLAIRELMRSDVTTLYQGVRNANDAISLIQTADGALQIIDEKLLRMKELSEQAATGTYDATQRLIINSEFQAMADEIDRISQATDFNGIKLLNGSLTGAHDGNGTTAQGKMKIHFGTGNDAAEDYYYISIEDCSVASLFPLDPAINWPGATVKDGKLTFEVKQQIAGNWQTGLDSYVIPSGLRNVKITSNNGANTVYHKPHVNLFSADGTQLTGYSPDDTTRSEWWNGLSGATVVTGQGFAANAVFDATKISTTAGATVTHNDLTVHLQTDQNENFNVPEILEIEEVTDNMVFLIGGHANNICNNYNLTITADIPHPSIETQQKAQEVLEKINIAIAKKDSIRAELGAVQNRFENTVNNLNIQAENLQVAESRISDVDVATEMTQFVRNQILTQSAVAMLSQANAMPQMAMQLISG